MIKEDYYMPVVLLALVPLFLLSLLSITFNGFYQPIRLALTGEMTPLVVVRKDVRINFGRNGPYDINYEVWVKEHEKRFPVKSELYDGIIEGETTQVFYSPELKWGIVSNEPLGWWGAMLSDSYHKPYITFFGFVIIVSWMMAFGLKRLIRESLIVYSKYCNKHANERDHLIRKVSVAGALVPYAVIVVFVYLISLYAMYAVFYVEPMDSFMTGVTAGLATMSVCTSPYLILKVRHILSNVRLMKIVAALTKITISIIATYRLLVFVRNNDVTETESVQKLGVELVKFVLGF